MHDRPRHHQALRHPAGEREHRHPGPIAEPKLIEQSVGLRLRGLRGHPEEPTVEVEVLVHVERPIERVGLGHDADDLLGARGVRHHIHTADDGAPARRDHARREHPRGGRLAGAVRPEQSEDLSRVHLEVEVVHRENIAGIDLGQLFGPDHDIAHAPPNLPGLVARERRLLLGSVPWLSRHTSWSTTSTSRTSRRDRPTVPSRCVCTGSPTTPTPGIC